MIRKKEVIRVGGCHGDDQPSTALSPDVCITLHVLGLITVLECSANKAAQFCLLPLSEAELIKIGIN